MDELHAFVPEGRFTVAGAADGPLGGLRFAAKDVIDVAGHPTGGGNPDWRRTHPVPQAHAPCLARLLEAGATLVGKTMTDEICCSMSGINPHYGTPLNPGAQGRLCGGSSCGSAAIVAAGDVDFALGTDTSGSVRVPAAWCGVYGMRPSHGRVTTEGVMPLAPTFDTVGWMARDLAMVTRVAECLMPSPLSLQGDGASAKLGDREATAVASRDRPARFLVALDAFGFVEPAVGEALLPAVRRLPSIRGVELYEGHLAEWFRAHATLVEDEFHPHLQPWIDAVHPVFGADVGARMEVGADRISAEARKDALDWRARIRKRLEALLGRDGVLCLPTVHCPPPSREASQDELSTAEVRVIALNCAASLAGLPQLTCPAGRVQGAGPVGLSFIGPRDADLWLLEVLRRQPLLTP